jgi:hypothetical protein
MKTKIYWTMQHSLRALRGFRFQGTCWWLSQQVEFLEWRMKLEAVVPPAPFNPAPVPVQQGGRHVVPQV